MAEVVQHGSGAGDGRVVVVQGEGAGVGVLGEEGAGLGHHAAGGREGGPGQEEGPPCRPTRHQLLELLHGGSI
jgi:hypothetical protein